MRIAPRPMLVISRVVGGMIVLSLAAAAQVTKSADDSVASAASSSGLIFQVRDRVSEPTSTPEPRQRGPITGAATATQAPSLSDFESIPRLATPTPAAGLRDLEPILRPATPSPTAGSRDLESIFRLATPSVTTRPRDFDPVLRLATATPSGRGTAPLGDPGAPTPVGMPLSSEPAPGSTLQHLGTDAAVSLFGPALAVRGQRAIFRWGPAPNAVLTVDYGPTQALGWRAVGEPVEVGSAIVQAAVLDGLQTGRSYYYRATLADGPRVLGEIPITQFETPHVAIRVRPLRIHVIKDGDTDTIFGKNYGEGRYSWEMRLDPRSDIWPPADMIGGCYPGGGTVQVGIPGTFRIPWGYGVYDGADLPGDQTPDPSYPPDAVPGCAEDYSEPTGTISHEANTAKVRSGETIQLQAQSEEWLLPDGAGNSSAVGPPGPAAIGQPPPTTAGEEPGPSSPPGGSPGGSGGSSGPPACEDRQPRGAFVPVYLTARGYEVDKVSSNFPGGGTEVRRQSARDTEVVCFDLRLSDERAEYSVDASEGNWAFRIWFEVSLVYRR